MQLHASDYPFPIMICHMLEIPTPHQRFTAWPVVRNPHWWPGLANSTLSLYVAGIGLAPILTGHGESPQKYHFHSVIPRRKNWSSFFFFIKMKIIVGFP
jgi:hypothetical protein